MLRFGRVFIILITVVCCAVQAMGETTVYGPKDLSRPPAGQYVESFTSASGPGFLELTNGEGEAAISYVRVFLNGKEIVTSRDFNRRVPYLKVPVDLQEENTLNLFMGGASSSLMTIRIVSERGGLPELPSKFAPVEELEMLPFAGEMVEAAKNQVLVSLVEDVTPDELARIVEAVRGMGGAILALNLDLRTIQIEVSDTADESAVIEALLEVPGVAHAGYNLLIGPTEWSLPSGLEGGLDSGYWMEHIGIEEAWEKVASLDLADRTIALVDDGWPAEQTIMEPERLELITIRDGSDDTDDYHGWKVGGFAGAFAEGDLPAVGVDHTAQMLMVDFKKFPTSLMEGVEIALNRGGDVINISQGLTEKFCEESSQFKDAWMRSFRDSLSGAFKETRLHDALIILSSSNGCFKEDDQILPNLDDPREEAWNSHALIVGATREDKADAWFSHMGQVVNLAAPGENVGFREGQSEDGTSFSTPMVAGVASLVKGVNSDLSAPEMRHIILKSAAPEVKTEYEPKLMLKADKAVESALLTRGADFEVLPQVWLEKGQQKERTISVTVPDVGVTALDVMFLVDVSGSYNDDIATLKSRAGSIVSDLSSQGIDVQFGVTAFSDFPINGYGYGSSGDEAYYLLQPVTSNLEDVFAGIDSLRVYNGADGPESQLEALYQVTTGAGRDINKDGDHDDLGEIPPQSAGWRPGALRLILFATDANFHDSDIELAYPGAGFDETLSALEETGTIVVGLQSGSSSYAEADILRVTEATGGSAYSLSTNSAEIAEAISLALDEALASIDVSLSVVASPEWVHSFSPAEVKGVAPGETVNFNVILEGQRRKSIDDLTYDVYLWFQGHDSALLKRVKIPIFVPRVARGGEGV